MSAFQIAVWLAVAVVALWMLGAYNRLVRQRNEITNAFAQIDVQLKRRHDLIPNLVDIARKYVAHERETFDAVTQARGNARSAADALRAAPADGPRASALGQAEAALGATLTRFMAVVEAYPDLKADRSLRELAEELTHTENRIAFARQAYNDAVLDYNNAAQQAPTVVVARVFSFRDAAMLAATGTEAERAPVRVQL